jgi:hypothetical protein
MGWASKRDGELLRLAEGEFDAFLTVDRKLPHQQKLFAFRIAVIVLVAPSNSYDAKNDCHGCSVPVSANSL